MKKTLIAVAAAAALASTSAFAEITFGAWLRVLASPIAHNGEDAMVGAENSWGWGARTARIDINGVSEDGMAGFSMGVYNDWEDGIANGDRMSMFVKPIEQVKLSIGKYDSPDNGLRGDFCYGSWNWLRPYNWAYDGEGLTFDGIQRNGLMAEVDPIDGLHIFGIIPMTSAYEKAEDAYKKAQVGFGYTIDGIGKIKAQWIGDYAEAGDYEKTGWVGVAFDLTAVENLYVTVGGRFGIADEEYENGDYTKVAVTAGASYQVTEAFKVSADGGFQMAYDDVYGDGDDSRFFFGAGLDYTIMDGLAAVGDVRFMNTGYGEKKDDSSVSFLVGLNKSVGSNGSLGIGFQGATNGCGLVTNDSEGLLPGGDKGDDFVWAIPVSISVWF